MEVEKRNSMKKEYLRYKISYEILKTRIMPYFDKKAIYGVKVLKNQINIKTLPNNKIIIY